MSLSASLKAKLQGSDPGNYWLCRISTPDRTRQYSVTPFRSSGSGAFLARVTDWGKIAYKLTDVGGTPNAVETSITISDTDRDWAQLVEGSYGDDVKGSSAVIFRAHPDLEEADWFTAFTGEVYDWEFSDPFKATIKLRTPDRVFTRQAPKGIWSIRGSMFPKTYADSVGQFLPIVYGWHDSRPYGNSGAIPGIRIGQYEYAFSAGCLKEITNVYNDGVLKSPDRWTADYPIIAGLQITRITFTTAPGANSVITADVQGYEDVGDGSGTLITAPVDQLAHLLTNFVIGDYRSGSWLTTSTVLDATAFASTYWSDREAVGSFYLNSQRKGYDILGDWLNTYEARAWWTPSGTLAIGVEDPTLADLYVDDPWLQWDKHTTTPFKQNRDDRRLTTGLTGHYTYEVSAGEYRQVLEVRNPLVDDDAPTSLNLPWSAVQ